MVERRPLVVVGGQTRELPSGDTLPSGPGGGDTTSITNSRVPFPLPAVGEWIGQHTTAIEANRPASGTLNLGPLWLPAGTYSNMLVGLANTGSAGALCRFVIYGDSTTSPGRPNGVVLLDSGAVSGEVSGVQASGLSLVVPAGGALMWSGVVSQGSPSTLPNYWVGSRTSLPPVTASDPTGLTFTNVGYGWSVSGVTGAAPASPTFVQGQVVSPRVFAKRSA